MTICIPDLMNIDAHMLVQVAYLVYAVLWEMGSQAYCADAIANRHIYRIIVGIIGAVQPYEPIFVFLKPVAVLRQIQAPSKSLAMLLRNCCDAMRFNISDRNRAGSVISIVSVKVLDRPMNHLCLFAMSVFFHRPYEPRFIEEDAYTCMIVGILRPHPVMVVPLSERMNTHVKIAEPRRLVRFIL